jgi:hypothetical protein
VGARGATGFSSAVLTPQTDANVATRPSEASALVTEPTFVFTVDLELTLGHRRGVQPFNR